MSYFTVNLLSYIDNKTTKVSLVHYAAIEFGTTLGTFVKLGAKLATKYTTNALNVDHYTGNETFTKGQDRQKW